MPVYCYKCNDCSEEFEVRHSMSFDGQLCLNCDSSSVFKVPSIGQAKVSKKSSSRPGKIVDEYIRDAKKEIKQEKLKLRSEEM